MVRSKEGGLLEAFARFREGPGFLISITVFLAVWFSLTYITGSDADHSLINVLLSIEAAYALPLLMMNSAKKDKDQEESRDMMRQQLALQQKQLKYVAHMMEGMLHVIALLAERSGVPSDVLDDIEKTSPDTGIDLGNTEAAQEP